MPVAESTSGASLEPNWAQLRSSDQTPFEPPTQYTVPAGGAGGDDGGDVGGGGVGGGGGVCVGGVVLLLYWLLSIVSILPIGMGLVESWPFPNRYSCQV